MCSQEEQAAKLKAEKIRVALEKIKEAQVKKVIFGLFPCLGFLSVLQIYKELPFLHNVFLRSGEVERYFILIFTFIFLWIKCIIKEVTGFKLF